MNENEDMQNKIENDVMKSNCCQKLKRVHPEYETRIPQGSGNSKKLVESIRILIMNSASWKNKQTLSLIIFGYRVSFFSEFLYSIEQDIHFTEKVANFSKRYHKKLIDILCPDLFQFYFLIFYRTPIFVPIFCTQQNKI